MYGTTLDVNLFYQYFTDGHIIHPCCDVKCGLRTTSCYVYVTLRTAKKTLRKKKAYNKMGKF